MIASKILKKLSTMYLYQKVNTSWKKEKEIRKLNIKKYSIYCSF